MLAPSEREKLGRILALLDSDVAGERDAAVMAAGRLLRRHGLRWAQLPLLPGPQVREPLHGTWRKVCAELATRPNELRQWERGFVTDLPRFPRVSSKQRHLLNEIAKRVLGDEIQ